MTAVEGRIDAPASVAGDDAEPPSRVRRLASSPLVQVAVVGTVVAALNLAWIAAHRRLGAYNVDEVGYVAKALRLQRVLSFTHPIEVVKEFYEPSSTGPLVPLLSVPLILVGSRTIWWALALQPILQVVTAVACAAVALHLAGRRAALLAGLVVLAVPGAIMSARLYMYGLPAAAFLCLAVWALLAADGWRRWWPTIAFGACVGSMLLVRTMTVGFLPGLGIAAAVLAGRSRPAWRRLAVSGVVALVVAGPWWIASRSVLGHYLLSYGYGDREHLVGPAAVSERVTRRLDELLRDVRAPFTVLALMVALATLVVSVTRLARGGWRPGRSATAVALVVVLGIATLFTTANTGQFFQLPLELLAVPVLVAAASRILRPWPAVARVGAALTVLLCVATVANSLADSTARPPGHDPKRTLPATLYLGIFDRLGSNAEVDPRLEAPDRQLRERAAREWWQASERLGAALDGELADDQWNVFTVSGNDNAINTQTLALDAELSVRAFADLEVPDSARSDRALAPFLTPEPNGRRRIIVCLRTGAKPFPEDRPPGRFCDLARRSGWEVAERVRLPLGDALVLRYASPERP